MIDTTVLVPVRGEALRRALGARIATLRVEAEEERKETEREKAEIVEWVRAMNEGQQQRYEQLKANYDRKLTEYRRVPRFIRYLRGMCKPIPIMVPFPARPPCIFWCSPKAAELAETEKLLPIPSGEVHISIDLAHKLGLVK